MSNRTSLNLVAYAESYIVVVEPWAEEYAIGVREACEVVALHPSVRPTFTVGIDSGRLIVYLNEGGATYEFWRSGRREFFTPIPIPSFPPEG